MEKEIKNPIRSFRDLEVYRNTYSAALTVMTKIVFKLPDSEKYDLKDQLARASKAVPRLIAEGYAKRHQIYKLSMAWTKFKKREAFDA